MVDKGDWRLQGQETYLKGITLYLKTYTRYSETWDHDHCEFCWAKFTEDHPDTLQEGYTTEDEYHWVCKKCFEDFKDMFGWEAAEAEL